MFAKALAKSRILRFPASSANPTSRRTPAIARPRALCVVHRTTPNNGRKRDTIRIEVVLESTASQATRSGRRGRLVFCYAS